MIDHLLNLSKVTKCLPNEGKQENLYERVADAFAGRDARITSTTAREIESVLRNHHRSMIAQVVSLKRRLVEREKAEKKAAKKVSSPKK